MQISPSRCGIPSKDPIPPSEPPTPSPVWLACGHYRPSSLSPPLPICYLFPTSSCRAGCVGALGQWPGARSLRASLSPPPLAAKPPCFANHSCRMSSTAGTVRPRSPVSTLQRRSARDCPKRCSQRALPCLACFSHPLLGPADSSPTTSTPAFRGLCGSPFSVRLPSSLNTSGSKERSSLNPVRCRVAVFAPATYPRQTHTQPYEALHDLSRLCVRPTRVSCGREQGLLRTTALSRTCRKGVDHQHLRRRGGCQRA